MIKINIPNNNIKEREYIIDIIFDEFFGLEYQIIIGTGNYEIILDNGSKLIFEDHFFTKYSNDLEYLKVENIPSKINFTTNKFIQEDDIPVIFGKSFLEIRNSDSIICGIDMFASSFFMLTRWEEYVNKTRDAHKRFPATESLAFKNNFLDRPIVNEYVEMLKNMMLSLDKNIVFKKKNFKLFLTHDVDELYQWKSWKHVLRVGLGDIIKRRSISLAFERIAEYFLIKREKINDPFDTFDWLMDKSESISIKSRFYFMSGGVTSYDNRYKIGEKKSLELISKIKKRKHIIGFHPSYNAYNNTRQFKKELELLEKTAKTKITEGREHYLRFEVPTTWQIWEDNGMKIDSTCGYADKEGFRCGTGNEYSVFNILTRKKLKLRERPLIYMDDNRPSGKRINDEKILVDNINNLKHKNIKYNSYNTFLFHQNIFLLKKINYKDIYETVIK